MANRFPAEIREDLTNWLHNICKPCHSSERICQLHQGNLPGPSSYTPSFNIVLSQDELFDKSSLHQQYKNHLYHLYQLVTYYMELEEETPHSNNQPNVQNHGVTTIRPTKVYDIILNKFPTNITITAITASHQQQVLSIPQCNITFFIWMLQKWC